MSFKDKYEKKKLYNVYVDKELPYYSIDNNILPLNNIHLSDYKIINNNCTSEFVNNKLWAHLHCFNIDLFGEIYGEYILNIMKYFNIVITYCEGNKIPELEVSIIKSQNKGMDIGPKFIMIHFLNNNNIHYDFILFLHSKSYKVSRKIYFQKMLSNLTETVKKLNNNYGVYTINLLKRESNNWDTCNFHMKHAIKTMKLSNCNYVFPEGNIYILHKSVADYIYDNRFDHYKHLNQSNSFDYSWFMYYYGFYKQQNKIDYQTAYKVFIDKNLYGNNLEASKNNDLLLRDAMIEHVFERIIFSVCGLMKKKIKILSFDNNKNQKLNDYIFNINSNIPKPNFITDRRTYFRSKKYKEFTIYYSHN